MRSAGIFRTGSKLAALAWSGLLACLLIACSAEPGALARTDGKLDSLVIRTADGQEVRFRVELARTPDELRLGLMHRQELAADAGMLFDFGPTPSPASMWMKNTLIPLDMAFINSNGVIVMIAENTTPLSLESVSSGRPVVAVLEVNGGALSAAGVAAGDRVQHPLFDGGR